MDELFESKSLNLDGYFLPISFEKARWSTIRNIIRKENNPVPILYLPEHSQLEKIDSNKKVCAFGIGIDNNKEQEAALNQTTTDHLGSSIWRHYSPLIHDSIYLSAIALAYHKQLKLSLSEALRMMAHPQGQQISFKDYDLIPAMLGKKEKLQINGISGPVSFNANGDNDPSALSYSEYHHEFGKGCYLE